MSFEDPVLRLFPAPVLSTLQVIGVVLIVVGAAVVAVVGIWPWLKARKAAAATEAA